MAASRLELNCAWILKRHLNKQLIKKHIKCIGDLPSQYQKSFNPEDYMGKYFPSNGGGLAAGSTYAWFADRFHDIFKTGTVRGARLLDIGTGPNIYSVVSASLYCENIFLSDLTPQNRDALSKWCDGSSPDSFRRIFEYITALEGKRCCPSDRESKLRRKVLAILPVNLLHESPFAPFTKLKADIITSSLCLEAATTEYDEYKNIVKRVMSLLEAGGHLVLSGVLTGSFYIIDGVTFKTCYLTSDEVKSAWTESGLKVITWQEKKHSPRDDDDGTGVFVMHGQKWA